MGERRCGRAGVGALAFAAVLGCAAPSSSDATGADQTGPADTGGETQAASSGDGADDTTGASVERSCPPPPGVSATPTSVAESVALINALPRPVSLDCFLESLERPLRITSTSSTVSLQPADGVRSPRVFLFSGELVMSIAIDGQGKALLEFGEPVSPTRSLKAEIEFPVTDELSIDDPFAGPHRDGGTSCGICHGFEELVVDGPSPEAFVSDALRFRDDELVEVDALRAEWEACDPDAEPERCARLDALFAHGDVVEELFSAGLPTIYDYG